MQDNFNIHSWNLNRALNEEESTISNIQTPFYFKSKMGIEGMSKDATFQIQDIPNYGNIKVYYYDGTLPRFFYMFKDELEKRIGGGDFIKSDESQFQPNMKESTFTDKYNDDPKLKGGQKDLPDALQAKIVAKEGEDHEVSMAISSLEDIAKAIVELRQHLGNVERDIPGWIQNHITNAENYIEQAAQGFHELEMSNDGIKTYMVNEDLDMNQTQLLSKEVAKALVLALKEENQELSSLKIKNLEPNSFEIYVTYKDEANDEFSFHVDGDKLKLSDFTFTEVLATVDENGNVDRNEVKDNLLKTWAKYFPKKDEN
jgi:hypothetical protein